MLKRNLKLFSTSGTFKVPASTHYMNLHVMCAGGGGGGGGASGASNFGASAGFAGGSGGGGAGGNAGYNVTQQIKVTPNSTLTITIGAPGTGGTGSVYGGAAATAGGSSTGIIVTDGTKTWRFSGAYTGAGFLGCTGGNGGGKGSNATTAANGTAGTAGATTDQEVIVPLRDKKSWFLEIDSSQK